MEKWLDIKGFEGYYQISNYGRVKSLPRFKRKNEKILKPYTNGTGYLQVGLRKPKEKVVMKLVHRLVMEHFHPIDNPEDYEVNHDDFDTRNNHEDNLYWESHKGNIEHYWDAVNENKRNRKIINGEKQHLSVLNEEKVREIRYLYNSGTITNLRELGRMYDVHPNTITQVIKRETWKHVE